MLCDPLPKADAKQEPDHKGREANNSDGAMEVFDKGMAERSDVIGSIVKISLHGSQGPFELDNGAFFGIGSAKVATVVLSCWDVWYKSSAC